MPIADAEQQRVPTRIRALALAAAGLFGIYAIYSLIEPAPRSGASGFGAVVVYGIFPAVYLLSAALCLTRARLGGPERLAWLFFGMGHVLEAAGWLSWNFGVRHLDPIPFPSISDAGWIGGYVLYLGGLLSLLRARTAHLRTISWLDGPVAALAVAAIGAGFVLDGMIAATGGSAAAIAVSMAYPIVDLIFAVLLAVVFAVNRWRPTGVWMLIAGAVTAQILVDTVYLSEVAAGTWRPGTVLDAGWGLAAVLIGVAAWLPRSEREQGDTADSLVVHGVPAVFTLVALAIVVYDHFDRVSDVALVLAALALVAGAIRSAAAFATARGLASQRAALEQTAAILRAAGESIYMIDAHGVVTYANPATGRTLGYEPEALVGQNMHEAVHHTRRDGLPFPLDECLICATLTDGRERRVNDDVFWHRRGNAIPVEYTVTPILEKGAIAGAAVVFSDVTDRRRAERDERARHAVARVIAEAGSLAEARAGVLSSIAEEMSFAGAIGWVADPQSGSLRCGVVTAARDEARLAAAVVGTQLPPGSAAPGAVLESGQVEWAAELGDHLSPEARRLAASIGAAGSVYMPILYGDQAIGVTQFLLRPGVEPDRSMLTTLGMIGAQVGQYSARRRAEAEAERLKNEFFALVSHELRTPLTSIVGYLDLLLEQENIDPDSRHYLTVVERNSDRLLRLVDDLLFVAQVGGGETTFEYGSVHLPTVTAQAVEAAGPRAREGGIHLVVDTEDLPPIEGDAGRVAQAIDNLVSNAIKFTPDGGEVRVGLSRRNGTAILEVSDTGIGIPADEQSRLFERFFRSTVATERAIQGVGLGLTIVKAIVDGHGGDIDVQSTEGKGTTFRVSLPLRPAPR